MTKFITDHSKLQTLSEIPEYNKIPALSGKAYKIISDLGNTSRKVELTSTVFYFKQEYLVDHEGTLHLINGDFKSLKKLEISDTSYQDKLVRECLLDEVYDNSAICYYFDKEDNELINTIIENEGKRINNKIKKEILSEYRSKDKAKKEEEIEPIHFQCKYLLVLMISKIKNKIYFSNDYSSIEAFIKSACDEIRYFISKKDYNECDQLYNKARNSVLCMSKELKLKISENDFQKLIQLLKPIFLNQTLILRSKQDDKGLNSTNCKELNEKIIKIGKEDYFKYYGNVIDDKFIKINRRMAEAYMNLNEFDKCIEHISYFESQISKLTNISETVMKEIEEINNIKQKVITIKSQIRQKVSKNTNNKAFFEYSLENTTKNEIQWDRCTNTLDFESDIHDLIKKLS